MIFLIPLHPIHLLPFLALFTPICTAQSRTVNQDLTSRLKNAATNFDRHCLLPSDSDWTYDFTSHRDFHSAVGAVITADAASFPALAGMGISVAILKLAPCGMLAPHFHARATNLVTAITGNTSTWMIGENGVRTVRVDLTPLKMVIFPVGSIHTMQNNDCDPALLVSSLSSEDAGTLNILNALWTTPHDIIDAAFGDDGLDTGRLGEKIPGVGTGAIIGSAECRKKCGIQHGKD